MWGIFRNIFKCECLPMHARQVTDVPCQGVHIVAYVITMSYIGFPYIRHHAWPIRELTSPGA